MPTGLDAVRYAAANARVRGLYAQLLGGDTWNTLISVEGYDAALSILRDTTYGSTIREVEQRGPLTIERLERRLLARAASNARLAMRLTRGGARDIIHVWWQHFELENLKAVFRGIDQGLPPETIQRLIVPLGERASLPWETLTHEATVQGLVERLQGTHYINPLRAALPVYERQGTLFPVEVALDIRYYRDLAAAIHALGGEDRADARDVFGAWLDILNILWAYRHREYYHLSAEEIVNYTLWHTERTDAGLIREIALGADPLDVIPRVFGPGAVDVGALPASRDPAEWMHRLERALYEHWRRLALRQMGGYPFRLGTFLGYLVLEELEAGDLVTLLEAKRMGWDAGLLVQHLIRGRE